MKKPLLSHTILSLTLSLTILSFIGSSLSAEFLFNGFNASDPLLLYGNATVRSNVLSLTNDTSFSIGRALFATKVATKRPNSSAVLPFSTSFIFAMAPYRNTLAGHGLVFLFTPATGIAGTSSAQNLGFLNRTNDGKPGNHVLGVYHDCDESIMLSCEDRIRILKDVASGVLYLHEGWESKVLHRDIKASNVLLDKEMNGRLGDFGLARMHGHGQVASTTRVVGTVGYLAPEVVRKGRASTLTDVFGFGALILEVMCGRRPIEEGKVPLVEWVWQMMVREQLFDAFDARLRARGEFDKEEVERVLHLGLLCAYPDPSARPSMRQVVKILEGKSDEVNDVESEDMNTYLLAKMRKGEMWTGFSQSFGYGSHPTFEDIKQSQSSSMSLSWSNTIVEGMLSNGDFKRQRM